MATHSDCGGEAAAAWHSFTLPLALALELVLVLVPAAGGRLKDAEVEVEQETDGAATPHAGGEADIRRGTALSRPLMTTANN